MPIVPGEARVADLEADLATALIGQERAIRTVARRLRLTRLELDASPDRPDGVFLFVGPSGVGKTLLARTLARALYASDDAFLHLDMSEYSESHAVARLAGAPPGYVGHEAEPRLVQRIRNRPRSLVLFDEIEKAHPQVLLLLLQILDSGRFTDSRGFTADFRRATIVMTSNLGRELYGDRFLGRRTPGFADVAAAPVGSPGLEAYRGALLRSLPAEFVGRIHDIVVFEPLSREALLRIARRRLDELRGRIGGHGKDVVVAEGVAEAIIDRGLDPALGARQLVSSIDQIVTAPLVDLMFTPAWHQAARVVVRARGTEIVVDVEG